MNIWCTTYTCYVFVHGSCVDVYVCVNSRQKDTFPVPIWRRWANGVVAVTMTVPGQSRGFASVPLRAAACVNIVVAPLAQGRHRRRRRVTTHSFSHTSLLFSFCHRVPLYTVNNASSSLSWWCRTDQWRAGIFPERQAHRIITWSVTFVSGAGFVIQKKYYLLV